MWTSATIGGRPADVFEPADRPRFVLLFLSDLDEVTPRDNPVWTTLFEANRIACVCPAGAETWWADRVHPPFDPTITGERYLLDVVRPWVTDHFELGANAVGLIGLGAGGQAALKLGFKYPTRFRAVAGLGSILDAYELHGRGTALDAMYANREQCRQDSAVLHIHPANWPPYIYFACDPDSPWLRGNDRLHEKLAALGVPHRTDFTTRVCGHSWTYYDYLARGVLKFVADGLAAESRRLM
jgi:S-formylglutathione hydrolase FrmB